jgi:hypothetical protein
MFPRIKIGSLYRVSILYFSKKIKIKALYSRKK